MASFYDWAFRWLQSLLALKICSVSQKIHKIVKKNENLPSKRRKMTFWSGRKKWRGRWTVNNSFRSVGLTPSWNPYKFTEFWLNNNNNVFQPTKHKEKLEKSSSNLTLCESIKQQAQEKSLGKSSKWKIVLRRVSTVETCQVVSHSLTLTKWVLHWLCQFLLNVN